MWRRDLTVLAPSGFVWNISRPDLKSVLAGALRPDTPTKPYNSDGWYPRPAKDAPVRGMEVLTRALAAKIHDLRLRHEVMSIQLSARTVLVRTPHGEATFVWRHRCVSTLPLPLLVSLCEDVPARVATAASGLEYNRVLSVAIRVLGPRPNVGLWRYYPSPSVLFTRLVFLHAFDPLMAPAQGWPLLAEVPWRTDEPLPDGFAQTIVKQAREVGALTPGHEVLDATVVEANPAYVVFHPGGSDAIETIISWLRSHGIDPVGRFGRWEYSSMAQALRDGHELASALAMTVATAG
jgi:protoporphyrinogen oxidase